MLSRTFGCVRRVWNRTLAWRHARYHGEQVKTNFTQANAYLTAMKRGPDLAWLNEVFSHRNPSLGRLQSPSFSFRAGSSQMPHLPGPPPRRHCPALAASI